MGEEARRFRRAFFLFSEGWALMPPINQALVGPLLTIPPAENPRPLQRELHQLALDRDEQLVLPVLRWLLGRLLPHQVQRNQL
jgi:hypothetical protein